MCTPGDTVLVTGTVYFSDAPWKTLNIASGWRAKITDIVSDNLGTAICLDLNDGEGLNELGPFLNSERGDFDIVKVCDCSTCRNEP